MDRLSSGRASCLADIFLGAKIFRTGNVYWQRGYGFSFDHILHRIA